MPFNFSSFEYLTHQRTRKNRVSPVGRASPAHMNSPLVLKCVTNRARVNSVLNLIGLNYKDEKLNHNFDIFLLAINRQY